MGVRNRFRDASTAQLLTEAECWLWDLTELDVDLEVAPESWAYPDQTRAFALAAIEDLNAELARRDGLRSRSTAPQWPSSWIDRRPDAVTIKQSVDLIAYIERTYGVVFERRGREVVCLCPLPGHDERTPSFSVHPEKQVWYCHGCHRGGDLFTFAMHIMGSDHFADVLDALAEEVVHERDLTPQGVSLG